MISGARHDLRVAVIGAGSWGTTLANHLAARACATTCSMRARSSATEAASPVASKMPRSSCRA